jgi:hypothetical protein
MHEYDHLDEASCIGAGIKERWAKAYETHKIVITQQYTAHIKSYLTPRQREHNVLKSKDYSNLYSS